jgi:hypothetical protein
VALRPEVTLAVIHISCSGCLVSATALTQSLPQSDSLCSPSVAETIQYTKVIIEANVKIIGRTIRRVRPRSQMAQTLSVRTATG